MNDAAELRHVLVYGFGVTNTAVVRCLVAHDVDVTLLDDRPTRAMQDAADDLGVAIVAPNEVGGGADVGRVLDRLLSGVDAVINAPGLPESHPIFAAALRAGVPLQSEFDLAARWDSRPLVSITGTNGKTTVTMLVTDMMNRSGRRAVAVGNTETPLVAAIDDDEVDVFVVEASSFRLAATQHFRPAVATWLNFAEDHLDVHGSLSTYELAKARSWRDLDRSSIAVANADDPVVVSHLGEGDATFHTYGLVGTPTDGARSNGRHASHYTLRSGDLITPDGEIIVSTAELRRSMPHDVSNALAAAATALAAGATMPAVREALREFRGLSHRVQFVGERDGIRWFDDSKATAPHAVIAAVEGFESVVLIAGGRDKGLDLSVLGQLQPRVRAVVGIGEAGPAVLAAFSSIPATVADSMALAVEQAASMARSGDAVLLSPGCASFDWYSNYGERGDDFAALVTELLGVGA